MTESIRVLVVDDHPLFRDGVVQSLSAAADMTVVGAASSGEEALAIACELLPDLVLLDMSMPKWNGIVTTAKITEACPATAIVILTASEDRDTLVEAFKVGARAYVLKGVSAQELLNVVRSVAAGDVYVSPSLAAGLLLSFTAPIQGTATAVPTPLDNLSSREREILSLIGTGMSNRAIGERLELSEKTIKHYVTNILQKLQVRSRVEAALIAAGKSNIRVN
jgi:two-component system nitrate/nitrite response regulator NarL